ncbi:aminodeoxychorismate synthase, component I [Lysobacter antibioticus]|uniref:aminodeoxychorismate synthase component I n=1 Tax=Lysobacter antibioticus TaxID=84531 RepID=UPI0007173DB1|nr:aminodeoxychorismate synthase component I [Lysobacter antibioticus]ALN61209.1 aminodeoxychorismate synthase, component I [Lysobacter antibioticus]
MRCLLIDNYDSFTWNLADQIGRAFGEAPIVVRNDEDDWDGLCARHRFDCVVISPGPGSVTREADVHVSREAIAHSGLPLLGVCLGFQGIAHAHGGRIVHAPVPFHGRASAVHHDGSDLFAGVPTPFEAIRYHSLIVASPLPPDLVATAHADPGLIMALRHRRLPQWGVQFHPESILTEHGIDLIANFRDLAHRHQRRPFVSLATPSPGPLPAESRRAESKQAESRQAESRQAESSDIGPARSLRVIARPLQGVGDPEAVFSALFAGRANAFWLDSQVAPDDSAGCSFMGAVDDADLLAYRIDEDDAALSRGQGLLADIERELEEAVIEDGIAEDGKRLPFDFRGGFVGFLGYEMKALFDGDRGEGHPTPDALWMRVRRFLAFDHATARAWALALAFEDETAAAEAWIDSVAAAAAQARGDDAPVASQGLQGLEVDMDLGRDDYLAAIGECQRAIVDGETYQVCLTNHFRFRAELDPYALYRQMRRGNAAPFGAFLRGRGIAVLSTSPERFLRVDRSGRVQTKPIKGTARRSGDPQLDARYARELAESVKDGAENLMIVDLMRNDLNRVSVAGTVEVPELRVVESYRTVHQLVSTVESQLRPDCSLIDLVRATFPGGSISGAPKKRTMEIIDRLERSPRGVYCGSIGYLGYNRVADLNIGIRTLSYDGETVAFGAGGAITYLSDPEAEFQEVLLKAEAVLRPVWRFLGDVSDGFAYELEADRLRLRVAKD